MGYLFSEKGFNKALDCMSEEYDVYGPIRFVGGGIHSDTDMIRYQKITDIETVVFDQKSNFSFKEVLLPIMQTIFYFTEQQVTEPEGPVKGAIILLRHCDLHAVKRLDAMYLENGPEDHYYRRVRDRVKFVVMGCPETFTNCFCVSMGTNIATNYDFSIDLVDGQYAVDCQDETFNTIFKAEAKKEEKVAPAYVTSNEVSVSIPTNLSAKVAFSSMWDEYDTRCIACGRCNFVCPTCTCNSMQDIFYQDNGRVGERRRVWASCMVDGYTEMAGGHSCRNKKGERMRFKVLHKVLDFKQRNGYHMCVGCGRCDDVCPEYISFSTSINKLEAAMEEVTNNDK